ncbi:MAG: phosphate ABC transporter permease PstA [Pseudomonadota bacterium]
MTDLAAPYAKPLDLHTSDAAHKRLKARYRSEARFKFFGMAAIGLAVLFLAILLYTIVSQGYHAFTYHYVKLPITLDQATIDPENTGDPEVIGRADYNTIVRQGLAEVLPFASERRERRVRNGLVTGAANIALRNEVMDNPELVGGKHFIRIQLDDFGDLYFKDLISDTTEVPINGTASPTGTEGDVKILSTANDFGFLANTARDYLTSLKVDAEEKEANKQRSVDRLTAEVESRTADLGAAADDAQKTRLQNALDVAKQSLAVAQADVERFELAAQDAERRLSVANATYSLNDQMPSFLIKINGGVVKVNSVSASQLEGTTYVPLQNTSDATAGTWQILEILKPESNRKLSDREIVWLEEFNRQGLVERGFNETFFTAGASREPEQAGILGAVMGSIFTMLVTLLLSFPIGVSAAIYLEEFAPKNRLTQLIEVNINNLAAVPSIVFGLLGLAMFLNIFGLPRSAPLVGGMVLALMTLPTIIIASRAALRSVPPSIREAALGIGASRLQAVTHHVLPLAMPGILTGTIIGMAQALGETAPLLMIGMVAFIVDIPGGPFDPSTVLPVQIFMWADFPEPAFQQKTSAAIMVLLVFLVVMNALAVILRKRFERRW